MVVLAAFSASQPGRARYSEVVRVLCQQRMTVAVLTSIQAAKCLLWVLLASLVPHQNTQYSYEKMIFECALGSTVGFSLLLSSGYPQSIIWFF